ncbi:MAG: cytochrome C [Chloroflexota bacterium]|nr:MAG: cytochrome C [Chloroflexota bacterium]
MNRPAIETQPHGTQQAEEFVRFNRGQRLEHLLLIITFTSLCVTGLPQKFAQNDVAAWIIVSLGGIETTRIIHRIVATVFVLQSLYHVAYIVLGVVRGNQKPHMVPGLRDVKDAIATLRYCLGFSNHKPLLDRYDPRQKFEYWGVVLGTAIMIVTGIVLWFPSQLTLILPGEFVPAAKEAHSGEALFAFLVIVVWHLYGTHLSPVNFPGDVSIFTGKVSRERMVEEHPLEYARALGTPVAELLHEQESTPKPVVTGDEPSSV